MDHPLQQAIYDGQAKSWAQREGLAELAGYPAEARHSAAAWDYWQRAWLEVNLISQELELTTEPEPAPIPIPPSPRLALPPGRRRRNRRPTVAESAVNVPRMPCGCPLDSGCTGWHQDTA